MKEKLINNQNKNPRNVNSKNLNHPMMLHLPRTAPQKINNLKRKERREEAKRAKV